MLNGNPELCDIIYDFIKARHPSASKVVMSDNYMEIFINGRLTVIVYGNKVHSYYYAFHSEIVPAADPNLFDKLILMCGPT